jgi:hypothetical protein
VSDTPREIPPEHAHIAAYAYPYLWEYHLGVAGEGEHAYTWQDKPHRLVFNLTSRCAFLERENADLKARLEAAQSDAERYRWLRDKALSVDWSRRLSANWRQSEFRASGSQMDFAIDAAMQEGK